MAPSSQVSEPPGNPGRFTVLLDIEPRLRKVMGYRHLPKLRDALMKELGLRPETKITRKAA